jgi:DNA-binding HxlR family transcriptional regulator
MHRSTRGDLDLIGNVERSVEVLSGKWKVYVLFFMAEVSDATAGSSSACREPRRRS